ncbi:CLUMA_CG007087, isoform A [Clunio marinus]|uniref:CLUMA_CG007087, isoform A n=1 Tax=Clunio marinus TaxID=568069 RepID=A0A1J1I1B9_9DIPT|nr:CLUMA_CG007087, isoform A [Clunio marinus]
MLVKNVKEKYEIFSFKIKSAESAIPKAWILERSIDGNNYEPWQYFAADDADCMSRYNLSGRNANYIFKDEKEVICSTEFSESTRLKYGEAKFLVLNQRPMESLTSNLINFTLARFIRVRLQGMLKNISEIESERSIKWEPDEDDLEKRRYYSIQSIIVLGRCHCSGHAGKCREQIDENDKNFNKLPQCECMHNTCGKNCEKCCPMYNQKPFRIGTPQKENRCEKCQCYGHASECRYSPDIDKRNLSINIKGKMTGGGVCLNCTKNTTGINCEKCLPNFFRPNNRPPDHEEPCIPCKCNSKGSVGACNPIGGDCICKPGFAGPNCDHCDIGFSGENCEKCSCDNRGILPGGECDEVCHCKMFVKGEKCDKCVDGYFGLNKENPEGCSKCFCSGIATTCESYEVKRNFTETLDGWSVTDISKTQIAYPTRDNETGYMVFGMYELADVEAVYWSAPEVYLGNRLEMKDIITRLRRTEYRGDPVTRTQFMSVLTNVDSILIRGTYHTDQAEGILRRATLYSGDISSSNDIIQVEASNVFSLVEKCHCPRGYDGLSCEECTFGHIKIYDNSTTHEKIIKCLPCNCNGHSESCNVETNECGECAHNTIGERCEECKIGFYGNALIGTSTDCKPCACPLIDELNNFSPTCELKESFETNGVMLEEMSDYFCNNCSVGHFGDHCELCADGYYGNPMELGSRCLACPCDGNPCDSITGKCIKCEVNTEGWRCEKCKKGFFGDPKVGCQICECSDYGAVNNLCNASDGKCSCNSNYEGQLCDQCAFGYANVSLHCPPCECNQNGSIDENCDPISGQCLCKLNVNGLKCDTCDELYFGLSANGCEGEFLLLLLAFIILKT